MSNTVICRECSTPNQTGSKFCNNCGARLPLSTNILCPTCQTPNPRNRLYCDNCGTRLVPDESSKPKLKKPEPKAEEPATPKGFSLPARKPGDTGELDPNSVPDWLKTGTTTPITSDAPPPSKPKDSGRLPRPDDLTPQKKTTADLPDWLVDSDSNTLFKQAPREITTEHYLDLLKRKEEEDSGFFIDDDTTISGSGANLPDWLAGLDTPKQPAANMPTISAGQMSEGAPDWLKELNQPTAPPKSDLPAAKTTKKEEDLTDWLLELGPPNTDILSPAKSGAFAEDETADWMAELGPPNTDILSSPPTKTGSSFSQNETADWLDDLGEPDSKLWTIPGQPQETAETSLSDDFDWLSEESAAPQPIASSESDDFDWLQAESTQATPQDQQSDDDFDWLAEETPTPEQPTMATTTPSPAWEDDLDWLTGGEETAEPPTTPAQAQAAEEFGWDDELDWAADEATTPQTTSETTTPPASSGFDWLMQETAESASDINFDEWETTSPETAESFEPELEQSGPLPSWLMNLGDTTDKTSTGELPEFDDTFLTDLPSETSSLNWLMQTGGLQQQAEPDFAAPETTEEPLSLGEEPDWLSEFGATPEPPTKTAEPPATIEPPQPVKDKFKSDAEAAFLFAAPEPEEPLIIEEPLIEPAIEEALPDWLQELGPRADTFSTPPTVEQSNLIPSDEMPQWVASMKPGSDFGESVLPNVMSSPSLSAESLDEIPIEFAGVELPDWLGDLPSTTPGPQATTLPLAETTSDIPDWLQTDETNRPEQRETAESASGTTTSELSSLLRDLPPPKPPQPLSKAEIPEWVQALKPKELTGGAPTDGQLESSGPLMGLRGVVNIEPIIAMPRSGGTVSAFTVTKEHEQQASLLRQLAREVTQSPTLVKPHKKDTALVWERVIMALAVIGAILIGLLGPKLFTPPSDVPPALANVNSAVLAAAGRPVLVAFEYSPAMAGELTPQAQMLLAQLQANNSPIITISQSAMGTAIAQQITADYASQTMPLIPGEAAGLRQLTACFSSTTGCPMFIGQPLDSDLVSQLQQVALIILLTSEQTSLQDWVEQVQTTTAIPVVAGLTQSLGPVAAPYQASGQLQGVIEGLPETAVYRAAYLTPDEALLNQFNAQQVAQLLTIGLLLVGGLYYGTKTTITRSRKKRSRA